MLFSGLYKTLIKKYTKLQLKKKTQEMSLWLKISFHNEKWSWDSLMLMYVMTLGESSIFDKFLENIIQFGWLDTSTSSSPLQFFKLGNKWIKDYEGSWIKTILNEICVLQIVLIMKSFLQMFCKKNLIFFKIMLECHSQLNKLIVFCYHEVLDISWSAILCWNDASRKNTDLNQLDIHL